MAMKFLAFHNQLVAYFSSDDQDNDFVSFHIIQGTQITCSKLELREWIRAQLLDGFRGRRGLVFEPGQDGCFQVSLVTCRQ
jgi:hypothetical protein